jgi:hypothetical protein
MKNLKQIIFILALMYAPGAIAAPVQGDGDSNNALDISKGGTNAATVSGARWNLSVPSKAEALVGDCSGLPCLDGTSDGGSWIKLYSGSGSYWTALQAGASAANRSWRLPIDAAPSAGTTRLLNVDEYGQMGFVDPATYATPTGSAASMTVDAAGFNGNLTSADNTLQEIAQALDDLTVSAGGYTNLTSFVDQNNWKVFYSDGSGDVKELSIGADGTYLKSNGSSAPTWATPSGSGDMVLATAQSVTGKKTFDDTKLAIKGSSTGVTTFDSANSSATDYTLNVPAANGTLATTADIVTLPSATEGQILQANSSGTYVSTSSFAGLINDSGSGTDDLWSASKIGTALGLKAPVDAPTFTSKVTTAASASGGAGFNLPHGAAPSSPVNGDIWTTSAGGLYARINGSTVGPLGTGGATVSDTAYGSGWNGDTTTAPSKNAVYDKLETMNAAAGFVDPAPTYSDSTCTKGQYSFDGSYWYVCEESNQWDRFAVTFAAWSNPTPAAPTLSSRTIGTNGTTLTLGGSASLSVGAGGNGGFDVDCSTAGSNITATYSSGAPGSSLVYTLGTTVNSGDTCDLDYTQPGNGIEATTGGADLASITSGSITNNSTQGSYTLQQDLGASSNDYNDLGNTGSTYIAYSFTTDSGYTLNRVGIQLAIGTGSPLQTPVTLYLYSNNAGQPGTLLATSTTTITGTLTGTAYYTADFSGYTLSGSTKYWIAAYYAENPDNKALFRGQGGGSEACYKSTDGSTWTSQQAGIQGTIRTYHP